MYGNENDTRGGVDENSLRNYCNDNGYDSGAVITAIDELNTEPLRVGIVKSGYNKGIYLYDHITDTSSEKVYKIIPSASESNVDSNYTYSELGWWEYDEDENILKTILLFPFRVVVMAVLWVMRAIAKVIRIIVKVNIGVPLSVVSILVALFIFLPIRVVLYVVSFGNVVFKEDEMFDWAHSIHFWMIYEFRGENSYRPYEVIGLYFLYYIQVMLVLSALGIVK